jgi:hypothetical protein
MRWLAYLLLFIVGVVVVGGGYVFYQNWQYQQQIDATYAIATQLGHTSQSHLAQVEACWDLQSHCGIFVYYTVEANRETFQADVERLEMEEVMSRDVDGRQLFTNINTHSTETLTVNGEDMRSPSAPEELIPRAYEWWVVNEDEQNVFITLYTTDPLQQYALNGQSVNQNIVSVMLQIR